MGSFKGIYRGSYKGTFKGSIKGLQLGQGFRSHPPGCLGFGDLRFRV